MLWMIECAAEGAISVVEMLFSTSLVAVVGAGEQVVFPTFEHTAGCVNMVVMWSDWQKLSCCAKCRIGYSVNLFCLAAGSLSTATECI